MFESGLLKEKKSKDEYYIKIEEKTKDESNKNLCKSQLVNRIIQHS
jgi:hypothetical protein